MTISSSDRERFQTTVSDFQPQIEEDMCLPTALKNVLDELATRTGESKLGLSLSRLNDICDYRSGFASSAERVPARLNPEISEIGFEVRTDTGLDFEDLQSVIENERTSLPIIDLHGDYFKHVEGYDPQPGIDGYPWSHTVIPFEVNSQVILFYDPFEEIFTRSSKVDVPPTKMEKSPVWDWWSRQDRWGMWIAQRDQAVIGQDLGGK